MSKIVCILDACTAINLICIDENDFLIKKLFKHLDIRFCEKVIKEIRDNVFKKLNLQNRRKEVDSIIGSFYGKRKFDKEIKNDCGDDFFQKIHELVNYQKENGEFYSSALALYISQLEDIKLFFHTDDSPAYEEFQEFFSMHQIGHIEDTADLILLLYRLDDKFSDTELIRFLDALFKEYAKELSICLKTLRHISSNINSDKKYRKNTNLKSLIHQLTQKLDRHDFSDIHILRQKLEAEKNPELKTFFKQYESVFMLDTNKNNKENYLKKIRQIQKLIKDGKFLNII